MAEFHRKFENHGTKIARDNQILITNSINLKLFTLILYGVGGRFDQRRFFQALYIYREVYAPTYRWPMIFIYIVSSLLKIIG